MSVTMREHCDICGDDITVYKGSVYRGRFQRFWRWPLKNDEPRGSLAICGQCWEDLAAAVREARAEASSASALPPRAAGVDGNE